MLLGKSVELCEVNSKFTLINLLKLASTWYFWDCNMVFVIFVQESNFGSIMLSTMLDVTLLRDSILGSTKALIRLKTF